MNNFITRYIDKFRPEITCIERNLLNKKIRRRNIGYKFLGSVFNNTELEHVLVNGVKKSKYYLIKPRDQIEYVSKPEGKFASSLFQVVVGAIIIATGQYWAIPEWLGTLGVGLVVSGIVSALSMLLLGSRKGVGALDATESKPELSGASNTINKGGILPCPLGFIRQTPYYGQNPYKLVLDGSSKNVYKQYFISNYKNVGVYDEKIGDTSINNFASNYLQITRSLGGSAFIGHENVLPVPRNEQLSVDTESSVRQQSTHIYNEASTSTTVQYDFQLTFENVVIGSWADKTFNVVVNVLDDLGDPVELTQDFVVTSGDLTLVSGDTYTYTGSHTFTQDITEIVTTVFSPVSKTRLNTAEIDAELDVEIDEEEITTDDFNETTTLNVGINYYTGIVSEVLETSPKECSEIDIIIKFPQGLFSLSDTGKRISRSTTIDIVFKNQTGSYQDLDQATLYIRDTDGTKTPLASSGSTTTVSGSTMTVYPPSDITQADELFYRPITLVMPSSDQWTVRVRSADLSVKDSNDVGSPYVDTFNFYVDGDPIDTDILPLVEQTTINATAYTQLSGTLEQYNRLLKTEYPVWNGTDWDTVEETNNPAAIIRAILTDTSLNPRAESIDIINNDTLVELYEWCEDNNYTVNAYISDQTKIGEIIGTILNNCRATFTIYNGKYYFVIDDDSKPVVEQITQHNSWGFTWSPAIGRLTEALRMSYIDEDEWNEDELTLYYYDGDTHTTPKVGTDDTDYLLIKQDVKYATNSDMVESMADYQLKVIQEKRNSYEFSVNLESMYLKMYDRILIANTCDMEYANTGLIKSVVTSGGNLTGFKLYTPIDITAGSKIIIRSLDFDNETYKINTYSVNNSGYTDSVQITPITYDGVIQGKGTITGISDTWNYDGDLFYIGVENPIEAIVIGVKYNDDMTAVVTAREA